MQPIPSATVPVAQGDGQGASPFTPSWRESKEQMQHHFMARLWPKRSRSARGRAEGPSARLLLHKIAAYPCLGDTILRPLVVRETVSGH